MHNYLYHAIVSPFYFHDENLKKINLSYPILILQSPAIETTLGVKWSGLNGGPCCMVKCYQLYTDWTIIGYRLVEIWWLLCFSGLSTEMVLKHDIIISHTKQYRLTSMDEKIWRIHQCRLAWLWWNFRWYVYHISCMYMR